MVGSSGAMGERSSEPTASILSLPLRAWGSETGRFSNVYAGEELELLSGEMAHRAGTRGAVVQHARLCFRERDDVLDRVHRHRGMRRQRKRAERRLHHRREVARGIIGKLA